MSNRQNKEHSVHTNILNAIKAAYSAGLADGARQAEVIAKLHAEHDLTVSEYTGFPFTVNPSDNGISYTVPAEATKPSAHPVRPPSKKGQRNVTPGEIVDQTPLPKIARGAKQPAGTREKGVKKGIIDVLGQCPEGVEITNIVGRTGFKDASVRGTLMGLKKKGIAINAKGIWSLAPAPSNAVFDNGSDEAGIVSEYA